jgi:serine/threonine protein kinase
VTTVAQAGEGLAHLHRQGVLHLDVTPANLCLHVPPPDSRPLWRRVRALLADWELSATFQGDAAAPRRGSPGYWAPEQAPAPAGPGEDAAIARPSRAPAAAGEGREDAGRGGAGRFSCYWQDVCDDCPRYARGDVCVS